MNFKIFWWLQTVSGHVDEQIEGIEGLEGLRMIGIEHDRDVLY